MSEIDINDIHRLVDSIVLNMEWAEEEITAAQERHPAATHLLEKSFRLLTPTHSLMSTEMVYRAHCRELLDRVARGEDTSLGTAAECCLVLRDVSLRAPMKPSAFGLYVRMWRLAGLPAIDLGEKSEHYEALFDSRIDDAETWLRSELRQVWRTPERHDQKEGSP